jgi:hypothetical protein
MSLYRYVLRGITCDSPNCAESFDIGPEHTVYDVRRHARRSGWSYISHKADADNGDFCPDHRPEGSPDV